MAVLRLVPSQGAATPVEVTQDRVVVGREATCDLVVNDGSVSRKHAIIERRGTGWAIVDQGSANGTFVDSQRVTDVVLHSGPGAALRGHGLSRRDRGRRPGRDDPDQPAGGDRHPGLAGEAAARSTRAATGPRGETRAALGPSRTIARRDAGAPSPDTGAARASRRHSAALAAAHRGRCSRRFRRGRPAHRRRHPGLPGLRLCPRDHCRGPREAPRPRAGHRPRASPAGPLFWAAGGCCGCLVLVLVFLGVIGGGAFYMTSGAVEATRAQLPTSRRATWPRRTAA